jgi:hypothetical protein
MGPGNAPADWFLAGGSVQFGVLPGQKHDPHCLGWFVTRTGHKPAGVLWVGTGPWFQLYGSNTFASNAVFEVSSYRDMISM